MPVGTDSVLLGAWTDIHPDDAVLDVGCGSGLIGLILCQRELTISLTGIDSSEGAIENCQLNYRAFGGKTKCMALHLSWPIGSKEGIGYDLIVSNPPYFQNDLRSQCTERNNWRHIENLGWHSLIRHGASLLNPGGRMSFVYPFLSIEEVLNDIASSELVLKRYVEVYPKVGHLPNRILVELVKDDAQSSIDTRKSSIAIRQSDGQYSPLFKRWTEDIYSVPLK